MTKVKTAVSLSPEILSNADKLADFLSTSRSHVFEMALSEFVDRHQNKQILEQLDAVYSEDSAEEIEQIQQMKPMHQSVVEEW